MVTVRLKILIRGFAPGAIDAYPPIERLQRFGVYSFLMTKNAHRLHACMFRAKSRVLFTRSCPANDEQISRITSTWTISFSENTSCSREGSACLVPSKTQFCVPVTCSVGTLSRRLMCVSTRTATAERMSGSVARALTARDSSGMSLRKAGIASLHLLRLLLSAGRTICRRSRSKNYMVESYMSLLSTTATRSETHNRVPHAPHPLQLLQIQIPIRLQRDVRIHFRCVFYWQTLQAVNITVVVAMPLDAYMTYEPVTGSGSLISMLY